MEALKGKGIPKYMIEKKNVEDAKRKKEAEKSGKGE